MSIKSFHKDLFDTAAAYVMSKQYTFSLNEFQGVLLHARL